MTRLPACAVSLCLLTLAGCSPRWHRAPTPPTANRQREVVDTRLSFDLGALTATAVITLGPSDQPGASLEIGDLVIEQVAVAGRALPFAVNASVLTLALPASEKPTTVEIAYRWRTHEWTSQDGFTGASSDGYTNIWPYHCGNLFPCHSDPSDGTTFSLTLYGVPPGKTAVYPASLSTEAPAYQIAWSIDAYTELPLGTTSAGTRVSAWHRPYEAERVVAGTQHLVAAFDWLERALGPYRFGDRVGPVAVNWPSKTHGGMEHHPHWHVDETAMSHPLVHVHEAAHGWFGDAIRLGCWEDFVLSEGTATYLAARALSVVAPPLGARAWRSYAKQLARMDGKLAVWPETCGTVDVLRDNLFTGAPYIRGAFFYKAVADRVGAERVDQALSQFYRDHAGRAAHMSDMLATLHAVTGYDPRPCAAMWLRNAHIPQPGPCP